MRISNLPFSMLMIVILLSFSAAVALENIALEDETAVEGWTYDEATGRWSYPAEWSYDQAAKAWEEGKYAEQAEEPREITKSFPAIDHTTMTEWTYDPATGMWVHPESWTYDEAAQAWEESGYALAGGLAITPQSDRAPEERSGWTYDEATGMWSYPAEWSYDQAAKAWDDGGYSNILFDDPGTTPDSLWYGLELWWEKIAEADQVHTYERFAEIRAMVEAGNYDAARYAAEQAAESIGIADKNMLASLSENRELLHQYENGVFLYEKYRDILEQYGQEYASTIDKALVEEIGLDRIAEAVVQEQTAINGYKETMEEALATEQGITREEAALQIEEEQTRGLADWQRKEVQENLLDAQEGLAELRKEFTLAAAAGRELPQAEAFAQLLVEAQIRLDQSQVAFTDGRFGKSFGQFVAAERALDNAKNFLERKVDAQEIGQVAKKYRQEREQEHRIYIEEYQQYRELVEHYPERAADIEREYQRSQKALELADKVALQLSAELSSLIAQGVSETEAVSKIQEKWAAEYERVYGEPYLPPVLKKVEEEVIAAAPDEAVSGWTYDQETGMWSYPTEWSYDQAAKAWEEGGYVKDSETASPSSPQISPPLDPATITEWTYDSATRMWVHPERWSYEEAAQKWDDGGYAFKESIEPTTAATDGGFVEGYTYIDPATGYNYEFSKDRYTYTTPLGIVHEAKLPEGYAAPPAYEKGNEEHQYTVETEEGKVQYKFYATGYETALPDGTSHTYAYEPGKYNLHGGGLVDLGVTGFDLRQAEEVQHYGYNPVYDTFVGDDGTAYRPDSYFQEGKFHYDSTEKSYKYEDEKTPTTQTEKAPTLAYDFSTNTWTAADGTTYAPERYLIAPVGHEEEKEFTTALGEAWVWNDALRTWNKAGGDVFHPEKGILERATGKIYTFDQSTGRFLDPQSGEAATDIAWSGVTWYFDSENKRWNPALEQGADGTEAEQPGWTYDAETGMWTHPESWSYEEAARKWEEGRYAQYIATGDRVVAQSESAQQKADIKDWTYDETTGMWNYPAEWSYDQAAKAWDEGGYAESSVGVKQAPIEKWTYDMSKGMWVYPEGWSSEEAAKAWEEGGYANSGVGVWTAGTSDSSGGTSTGNSGSEGESSSTGSAASANAGTAGSVWSYDSSSGSWSSREGVSYGEAAKAWESEVLPSITGGAVTSSPQNEEKPREEQKHNPLFIWLQRYLGLKN